MLHPTDYWYAFDFPLWWIPFPSFFSRFLFRLTSVPLSPVSSFSLSLQAMADSKHMLPFDFDITYYFLCCYDKNWDTIQSSNSDVFYATLNRLRRNNDYTVSTFRYSRGKTFLVSQPNETMIFMRDEIDIAGSFFRCIRSTSTNYLCYCKKFATFPHTCPPQCLSLCVDLQEKIDFNLLLKLLRQEEGEHRVFYDKKVHPSIIWRCEKTRAGSNCLLFISQAKKITFKNVTDYQFGNELLVCIQRVIEKYCTRYLS